MRRQSILIAAAVAMLAGCGNGRNGYESAPLLPQVDDPALRRTSDSIGIAHEDDRFLELMPFVKVERATHDNQYGYLVTYSVSGSDLALFWPRSQIHFTGRAPRYTIESVPLDQGQLLIPTHVTETSLPRVHGAIQILEQSYGREADGAIHAMETFSLVISMIGGRASIRAANVNGPTNTGSSAGGASVVGGQVVKKGFKRFTEANFRENLGRLTGGIPKNAHAHHVLPKELNLYFRKAGINIHDPHYGAWWPANAHLSRARAYNNAWRKFFEDIPERSAQEILQFARTIANRYELQIYF